MLHGKPLQHLLPEAVALFLALLGVHRRLSPTVLRLLQMALVRSAIPAQEHLHLRSLRKLVEVLAAFHEHREIDPIHGLAPRLSLNNGAFRDHTLLGQVAQVLPEEGGGQRLLLQDDLRRRLWFKGWGEEGTSQDRWARTVGSPSSEFGAQFWSLGPLLHEACESPGLKSEACA